MIHVAIMKKSWGFTDKILDGRKTVESRWYLSKRAPWDMIEKGDRVYFKNSGEPVSVRAEVTKVIQFSDLKQAKVKEILAKYGKNIGIEEKNAAGFFEKFKDKKYCILVFLENPRHVKLFDINKKGFGAMASWITVPNLHEIQQISQG